MNQLDAIMALEGGEFDDALDCAVAMQVIINGGDGWRMQGSMGRGMMAAIENGDCMLGPNACHDYWGNRIPARTDVEPGTKGSREFVEAQHDAEWVEALEAA